jgi:hypothetical protein
MIKRILLVAFFLCYAQSGWTEKSATLRPGHFFKLSTYVDTLTINTVTPSWTYPTAGIKVLTPGYTVALINPTANGFHLFSVSDTASARITLVGAPGPVSIKLCLNAVGSGSGCEVLTVTLSQQQYAYLATGFNNMVYKCQVNSDGKLNNCVPSPLSGAPSWIPESIAFATVNAVRYAYVASWQPNGVVYQCTLNSAGSFDTCNPLSPTGMVYTYAAGITFATINGIQYAYVSDGVENVYQCSLNNNGTFNVCNPTPTSGAPVWTPASTTFATIGGIQYAYVTDDSGLLYQCSLNVNGTFNLCTITPASGAPVWLPKAITFASFGGAQYAYVADDNGYVFQCSLNSNGSLNQCSSTPVVGKPDWTPRAIAFATFGETQYAYVTDFGTAISLPGEIYQCTLDAAGKFTSCVPTPAFGMPSWGNLWWMTFN